VPGGKRLGGKRSRVSAFFKSTGSQEQIGGWSSGKPQTRGGGNESGGKYAGLAWGERKDMVIFGGGGRGEGSEGGTKA